MACRPADKGSDCTALQQPWQIAGKTGGFADQAAAEGRGLVYGAEGEISAEAEERIVVGEDAVDPVCCCSESRDIKAAPAAVALQHIGCADILAATASFDKDLGEGRDITKAEIEALACEGVDAVGRISRERHTRGGEALGKGKAKGVGVTAPSQGNLTKMCAEAGAKCLKIGCIIERRDRLGPLFPLCPDNGRAIARQGQDGKRAFRHEELVRAALVGLFMVDRSHEAGLAVGPFGAADTCAAGHFGASAIGADEQAGAVLGAIFERYGNTAGRDFLRHNLRFRKQSDEFGLRHGFQQRIAQIAVLQKMAHRALVYLRVVEMEEEGRGTFPRAAITDADIEDGLGVLLHALPDAQRLQHSTCAVGKRIGAAIEARVAKGLQRSAIHQQAGNSAAGQRQGKGRAVQPCTNNDDIASLHKPHYGMLPAIVHAPLCRYRLAKGHSLREWMMDLRASAADLGRGIGAGEIDAVELTEAMLEAVAAHPEHDRIYARMMPERARAEAESAAMRAKAGVRKGLLDGVPISWKDLYDTAGVATESGSRLLEGRVPVRDAQVLERASGAGLVCLGKTHQTELAFSGLGINTQTATPPNSVKADLAPGGSSSGAAVSVGLGLAAAGIGSDTGGSVRIPPAWNDLVGLKPAHGELPLAGVVPLCAKFDTVGPICRNMEDTAELYAVLRAEKPTDLGETSLSGLRFLVLQTPGVAGADDAPQAAFEDAVERLSAAGAHVETGGVEGVDEALGMSGVLYTTEAYGTWGTVIEAEPEKMDRLVRARFEAGKAYSGADYVRAWLRLEELRRIYTDATRGYDAVLLPTAPILPPPVKRLLEDGDYFVERNLLALRNTRVGNLMGSAALTLPTGTPHCGIMAMAGPGHTQHLLRIGAAMEKALLPGK